jgi:hypothetical protein
MKTPYPDLPESRIAYIRQVPVATLPDEIRQQLPGVSEVYGIHTEEGECLALAKRRQDGLRAGPAARSGAGQRALIHPAKATSGPSGSGPSGAMRLRPAREPVAGPIGDPALALRVHRSARGR